MESKAIIQYGPFDLIVCSHVFEHISVDTIQESVAAFYNFLKPNGSLVIFSFFTLPIVLSTNGAIWQNTINPKVLGRVLSLFNTVTGLGFAFGNLSASPLVDGILEPMLSADGALANTVGKLVETGEGRGIGFLMIIQGLLVFITSVSLYNYFSWIEKTEELIIIDSSLVENETIDKLGSQQPTTDPEVG